MPAALLLFAATVQAAPLDLYVSPTGRDTWSGRLPAANAAGTDGPFATPAHAQQEVRRLRAAGKVPVGVNVNLRAGTYELAKPLTLGPEDSGTADAPVVWRGYRDERPVLSGSRVVTGFTPWRDGILQADLKGTPLAGKVFRQLFFRGERMVMARYPNVDPADPHCGTWAYVADSDPAPATNNSVSDNVERTKDHFTATKDVIKPGWEHLERAEVCIHPAYGWAWSVVPIKAADRASGVIALGKNVGYGIVVGDRYFVRNLLAELDAPGEWYLDPDSDTLYFKPPADLATGEVRAPVTDRLAVMEKAAHVTLRGFALEACDGDAVRIQDCESCRLSASVVRNCGGWAATIAGGHHNAVIGCDLSATGAGGVSLSGGDRKTLERGDNRADNNYIHHIAEFQRTYNTGVNVNGVGNTASHNLIHDCYHQAILMGGNDNVVEYNVIHHTNLGSEDTGGVYMSSRDYTQRGNVIRHNVFHHIGGFGKASSWQPVVDGKVKFEYPHFTWGIYLDAPEVGVTVYGNVLYSVPVCGLFNHEGRDNTWENNIVVDAPGFQLSSGNYPDLDELSYSYVKRLRADGTYAVYGGHYPALDGYTDDPASRHSVAGSKFVRNIVYYTPAGGQRLRDQNKGAWQGGQLVWSWRGAKADLPRFEFDGNCIWGPPGLDLKFRLDAQPEPGKLLTWDEWRQTGQDAHSLVADPLFVDPEHHDYRLRPDSPALKLGFKPIPFEQIGPYQDELRASWPVVEAPGAARLGDFVTVRYFQVQGHEPLPAAELRPRGGLPRLARKLAAREPVTIVCFAGGSHAQGGWFNAFIDKLRQAHPAVEIKGALAAIDGGARGSAFSLYRFRHEALESHPDLVIVDFAADDSETNATLTERVAEGLVRQAWEADPAPDLLLVQSFRAGYETSYAEGLSPAAVSAWERVGERYGLPSVDFGCRLAAEVRAGVWLVRATPEEAKQPGAKPAFTTDGVYTSPAAWAHEAEVAAEGLDKLLAAAPTASDRAAAVARPLRPDHLQRARQIPVTKAMLEGAWEEQPAEGFAQHFERVWLTRTPGAKLTFRFRGTAASLFDLMGPDTGRAKVTVDGRDRGQRQQVDRWCYYQRLSAMELASGLPDAEHTVTVELLPDVPDRAEPIAEAKRLNRYDAKAFEGVALRIGWIRVVGEAVE